MDRRDFLKLVGLATGTSVVAGCDLERTSEKLIPYLVPPEDGLIPGEASFSTSTCTECPAACGVSVRIREKRPVKLEGIGGHPINDGGLCMRGQASLNRLYHTERVRSPMVADGNGNLVPATWNQALERVVTALEQANGEKLFLAGHTTGSISEMIDEFCSRMGVRRLPEFEMYSGAAVRAANEELFGLPTVPAYRFDKSDFLLTVGADILDTFGNPVAATSQIARQRAEGRGFTWYHAEAHASLTGFQSGHRLSVRPGSEVYLLACLLH